MKSMTKTELARAAGVNRTTLQRWLQDPVIKEQLAAFNLKKNQKKLPPCAVQVICDHYVISSEATIND